MNINNIDDIRKLASGDEGGRTEYKLTTGQLERGMETLCAFLNGEGGTVLFGVKDNGKIIGQEVSDKTKREMAEAIRLIEPFATITVSYAGIPDTDKQVIVLCAEEQRYMLEKPRDFDPFGQTGFAHLWLQYDCPFKVLVLGGNFILPF